MTRHSLRSTHTWSFIFAVSFLAIVIAYSSSALAGNPDFWNVVNGNWSNAANWSTGVPSSSNTVVQITDNDTTSRTINYDYTGTAFTLAPLTIDNTGFGTNTLSMSANTLTTSGIIIGNGNGGNGAMIQSGGTHTDSAAVIGYQSGSNGSYTISNSGTSYSVNGAAGLEVGNGGTGTFTENGGSVLMSGGATLYVGYSNTGLGNYVLNGGTLTASGQFEYVGFNATGNSFSSGGTFNQTGGSNSAGGILLGYSAGSTGTYNLSGTGSVSGTNLYVGYVGTGSFVQSGGTNNISFVTVGGLSGDSGTYSLTAGSLNPTAGIVVGGNSTSAGGTGVLNISGSGSLSTGPLKVYNTPGTSLNLNGGSLSVTSLNFNGTPSVFHWTAGTLSISNNLIIDPGASPTSTSAAFGNSLTLGLEQALGIIGDETLGGAGAFAMTVGTGANNTVIGNLTVNSNSQLYLSGGTISANNLLVNGNGIFRWTAGTLNINGSQGVTFGSGTPLGSVFTLGSGQTLNLYNSATVNSGSVLTINGGNLSGYSMINNGNVALNSGGFNFYTLFNQAGSLFEIGQNALAYIQGPATNAGEINLGGDGAMLYNAQGYSINNTGLIHGDGVIAMNVSNSTGEIRAEDGKRLKITGSLGINYGKINLQGGTLELTYPFNNGAGSGQIEGRGTLIVGGTGLTNNGNMAFSAGISDVFGDVHNSTGSASQGITISGNANVTFWDDVTNGTSSSDPTLFKVSSGSAVTFFGTYSGNGVSGPGSVFYEADVSPGFSPASVNYGGNVSLDSTARLNIQLGGTTVGSQYDKLNVAGQLSLDGELNVSLINNFHPKTGDTFDVLDWHSLSGTFTDVVLPTLGGRIVWNSSQLYTTGNLSVVATYYTGDFNRDGHVDASDILAAMKALTNLTGYESQYAVTASTLPLIADVNGDGLVNNADLQALLNLLNSGGGSTNPVPEPASVLLAVCALACFGSFSHKHFTRTTSLKLAPACSTAN